MSNKIVKMLKALEQSVSKIGVDKTIESLVNSDETPLLLHFRIKNTASLNEKEELSVYLSSSPPPFCPRGRVTDKDAILRIINCAERYYIYYICNMLIN